MKKNILITTFKLSVFILALSLFCSNKTYSQETKDQIENSVYSLKEKLILNEEQVNSIKKILNDFFQKKLNESEIDSSKLISETNKKIEAYLDNKQRIKFDVIKSDWWNKLFGVKASE